MNLSKSRIMAGYQCLKRLYLQVHEPELACNLEEESRAVIEQGQEVGRLAQTMFPGGELIGAKDEGLGRALAQTEAAIGNDQIPALFEGAFQHDGIFVRTDILQHNSRNKWRLIEVKSSTQRKNHYLYDVAIQRLVLEGCGLDVVPCLMYLNRAYVYDGKQYELGKLFHIEDLTDETAALSKDVKELIRAQRILLDKPQPPDVGPGKQCGDPVTCEFYDLCNKDLPEDHIRNLPGLSAQKLVKLTEKRIERIGDIPKSFELTERQRRVQECVKSGRAWFGKGLKDELAGLTHPIYFMDFETLGLALPKFAGMRPYDQLPFQWSVHIQRSPTAPLEHHEFLADGQDDPRPAFVKSLCQTIDRKGSVVVYNRGFESGCLKNLAVWVPEYKQAVSGIQDRLWDLLPVVRAHVYHPAFVGSFSLKKVLPALVPELTYEGMEVSEGSEAGLVWEKINCDQLDSEERNRLRTALLTYCQQDTLAMVRLVEVLGAR